MIRSASPGSPVGPAHPTVTAKCAAWLRPREDTPIRTRPGKDAAKRSAGRATVDRTWRSACFGSCLGEPLWLDRDVEAGGRDGFTWKEQSKGLEGVKSHCR